MAVGSSLDMRNEEDMMDTASLVSPLFNKYSRNDTVSSSNTEDMCTLNCTIVCGPGE